MSLPRHDCDLTLANMFSNFFLVKIQDIRNQIVGDSTITDADPVTACIFSMFTEVSVKSVKNTIMASNSKTCCYEKLCVTCVTYQNSLERS